MTHISASKGEEKGVMLAASLSGTPAHPCVTVEDVRRPEAEANRIIVEVASAGVTRMEPRWSTSWKGSDGGLRKQPVILGLEFAGRVRSLGSGVRGFAVGQDVLGMLEPSRGGAMATFVSAAADHVLAMPSVLSYENASVLPLAGLTAWQGLIRHGELKRRQRVLIHGGAGGVGSFATQLARWIGAYVVVTAAKEDTEVCRCLGADEVVNFEREHFEDRGEMYDLVFDQIGGEVQERSWAVLKRGGRLVTIAGEEKDAPDQKRARALGVTALFFVVENNIGELSQLTNVVASGAVAPVIGRRVALASAAECFDNRLGHFAGKAVLLCC